VVTFDSDTRTLTVTGDSGTAGDYNILVSAVAPNGITIPSPTMTIALSLASACEPPTAVVAPTIPAASAKLDNTAQSIEWDAWTSTGPAGCVMTYSVEIPTAIKDVVTANLVTRTIEIAKSTDSTLAGEYDVVITALTPSGLAIAAGNTATMKLTLAKGSSSSTTGIAAVASKVIRNIAVTTTTARVARNLVRAGQDSSITQRARRAGTRTATNFDDGRSVPTGSSSPSTSSNPGPGVPTFDTPVATPTGSTSGNSNTKQGGATPTDASNDAFASAKSENHKPEPGMNSFDFALDNLSGIYGDLDL